MATWGIGLVRQYLALFFLVFLGLIITGCASSPGVQTAEEFTENSTAEFVDWGKLDWKK